MNYYDEILKTVYSAIDEINDTLPKNKHLEKKEETIIFGTDGKLDSLGLVNFIVNVESLIYDKFEKSIIIADEKAMSMQNSPFRNIKVLCEYIDKLLSEE